MQTTTKQRIQNLIKSEITQIQKLPGGMISDVYKIEFAQHDPIVAKLSDENHDLTIEAYMLQYLKSHSTLPIPNVLHASPQLLLLEYIEGTAGLNTTTQNQLGYLMADLHQVTAPQYGLEQDTLIGPIHQPNPLADSWIDFFRHQRLLYMANIAMKSGYLTKSLFNRTQTLAHKLDTVLIEPDSPTLIHGDMWTTNIIVRQNEVVGIIDPALYYGHHEMELAYMTLFDSVGQAFFDTYTEVMNVDKDFFNLRRHVYNLYPLLVHVKIFGQRYNAMVDSSLQKLGF